MWDETTLRQLAAALSLLLYGALCARTWLGQRAREQHAAAEPNGGESLLLAWASQSGQAEEIARQSARLLRASGQSVQLCALGQLDAARLARTRRALFIVSTCGEGDAPDNAARFQQQHMGGQALLPELQYGLLALGDSSYAHYCGFGRALDAWLQNAGARPWFARIDMDSGAAPALHAWQQGLQRHICPTATLDALDAPQYHEWTLARREHLNPGSCGEAMHHLELEAKDGPAPCWESGDLLQLHIPADPDKPREYSIASIASDGRIHLMVRLSRRADGRPGLASQWLLQDLAPGQSLRARLRAHRNFRLEDNATRPLILIGNGTGLAGLRSHLKARAAAQAGPNWLLFGERHAAHDRPYGAELHAWRQSGVLQRLDLAFSRDPGDCPYVQDHLLRARDLLHTWVQEMGAAIYVCGSLQGMAQGVEQVLVQVLGTETLEQLRHSGRYRRDVY